MDSQRFDDLARALASGASRRSVLKGLVATVAGGALSAIAGRETPSVGAQSTCRTLGESCKNDSSCCTGQNLFCQQIGETGAHRCECTSGFVACNGLCVSLT